MTHLLIIGGSDAGISAALRAREVNPAGDVTVVVADAFPNYSICGLPFYLSGEVTDWHHLAHRTATEIEQKGIRLVLDTAATAINPRTKTVTLQGSSPQTVSYDTLVIATGAVPVTSTLVGSTLPGVYPLHTMADSFAVQRHFAKHAPRKAVIIGGGYIGLEMADALTLRGLTVTLIDHNPTILKTVDASLGHLAQAELERHGVRIMTKMRVEGIEHTSAGLQVQTTDERIDTDLVILAVGVRPHTELALTAGIETGVRGAIRVTQAMATNVPAIYAAGDCVETWHRLLAGPTYLPLGTTAHKQGRVAGENAVGGQRLFPGSLGTHVLKVFELAFARTGLRDDEARVAGFEPYTHELTVWDHKAYYPGAQELSIRVTGDRRTGRLLGAQIGGHYQAEVAKRIDIFATALFHGMTVDACSDLDLSYTPPLSSPWDPIQMSTQAWVLACQDQ